MSAVICMLTEETMDKGKPRLVLSPPGVTTSFSVNTVSVKQYVL